MKSKNRKKFDPHRLLFNLSEKINSKRRDKYAIYSICHTWTNIKKSYKNIEFKISAPTWNEEFELNDR